MQGASGSALLQLVIGGVSGYVVAGGWDCISIEAGAGAGADTGVFVHEKMQSLEQDGLLNPASHVFPPRLVPSHCSPASIFPLPHTALGLQSLEQEVVDSPFSHLPFPQTIGLAAAVGVVVVVVVVAEDSSSGGDATGSSAAEASVAVGLSDVS